MQKENQIKLDKTDYKILAALDGNSRIPSTRLAKKLRLSRNVTDYRIRQLQEKGVIRAFNAFVDPAKFNQISWKVYLRFQNLTPEKEEELLGYLKEHPHVWWIIRCAGAFDLMFCVLAESIHEFYQYMLEFNTHFSAYVGETELTSHIDPEFYSRGYLGKDSTLASRPFLVKPMAKTFDRLDIGIMRLLGQNARLPITEIAQKLKTTPKAIRYRMDRLEQEGIIIWYRIVLDASKLGREYYKTLVNFKEITKEKETAFLGFCRSHPDIINMSKAAGPWDMEFECEVQSYQRYNELMQEIRQKFPELIKQYRSLLIYEQLKYENNFLEYGELSTRRS